MTKPEPTLHVVFHGTFVFCKRKANEPKDERFRVYVPKVPSHIYLAGNWLGETRLDPGAYRLETVLPPKASVELPHKDNLVVSGPHPPDIDQRVHAVIDMPSPDRILTPRSVAVPSTEFEHKVEKDPAKARRLVEDLLRGTGYEGRLGSIIVFTYRFADVFDLSLTRLGDSGQPDGAHPWIPVPSGACKDLPLGTVNLHIFAAHEVEEDLDEGQSAFNLMTELFQAFPLGLQRTSLEAELDVKKLPAGVIQTECEDLSLRSQRLAKLGRLKRNRLDLNHLWFSSEGFNSEPSGCTCSFCC